LTHPAKHVLGAVLVLAGIAVVFLVARRLVLDVIVKIWQFGVLITLWRLGLFVLVGSVAVYLIRSGLRMINPRVFGPFRFGWGKILFGVVILYMQLGFDYHFIPRGRRPIPNPSTMNQAVSVLIWDLIGVYLIFRGIWRGFYQRERQPNIPGLQSPESTNEVVGQ
jgi:hypothetical protein